jgi:CAAX prenyl protease-like protein
MMAGAFSSGFDWLYPMRVVAVVVVVWLCRNSYGELSGGCSWMALTLGTATFVVWVLLAGDDPADEGWPKVLTAAPTGWAAAWLAWRLIGHVIAVPLAEELAFRGFLIREFTRRDFLTVAPDQFSLPAFVASSVLFGGLHGKSWLAGTLAGMLFALAQRRHGKISDAVLAHATANALLAGYVLVSGRWSLW